MFSKFKKMILIHVKNNFKIYFFLLLAFIIGVSAGSFTVNGLSSMQRDELNSYFQGFLQLLDNQKVDSNELLKISFIENIRFIIVLWILGVTIIGIPFIFIIIGIRGFIVGFSSGFVISTMGIKGLLFTVFALIPKELIIVPCIIALGVNGIKFSLNIIKSKSIKQISKENLKNNLVAYSAFTVLFTGLIFIGILLEAYITPVFIRIISPIIAN